MTRKQKQWHYFYRGMESLGFSTEEADQLRRIEMTLHRWSERECNGEIERDEKNGKAYFSNPNTGEHMCYIIPDREAGALKRLEAIMSSHPDLWYFHQTDPRGCALYVGRKDKLPEGISLDSYYSSGFGVCV